MVFQVTKLGVGSDGVVLLPGSLRCLGEEGVKIGKEVEKRVGYSDIKRVKRDAERREGERFPKGNCKERSWESDLD